MGNEKKRFIRVVLLALAAVIVAAMLSLLLGAVSFSPAELWQALWGNGAETTRSILLHIRLPRTLAALFCGAALALAGVVIQAVLGNPLAAPGVIGVNAGASFFVAVLAAVLPAAGLQWQAAAAFLGALVTVFAVWGIARATETSRVALVLAGVAISGIFSAGVDALITLFPDALMGISAFRIGGFAGVNVARLGPAVLCASAGAALVFCLRHEMDLLTLGEETAAGLGVPVKTVRLLLLAGAAALAGAAVSVAGLIGFVGLMVPHIGRRLVGGSSGKLGIVAVLLGAALVTLCDVLARVLFAPYEISVGIVLSFLGGPFFLWLLLRGRRV